MYVVNAMSTITFESLPSAFIVRWPAALQQPASYTVLYGLTATPLNEQFTMYAVSTTSNSAQLANVTTENYTIQVFSIQPDGVAVLEHSGTASGRIKPKLTALNFSATTRNRLEVVLHKPRSADKSLAIVDKKGDPTTMLTYSNTVSLTTMNGVPCAAGDVFLLHGLRLRLVTY